MKRTIFSLTLFTVFFAAHAQLKLGLKFAPVISSNRVEIDSETYDVDKIQSSVKFSLGLIADKSFSDSYYFSTGLLIMPKVVGFSLIDEAGMINTEKYNLQYLHIPVSLKLFTNELRPDLNIFFQIGGALELKLDDKASDDDYDAINNFTPVDAVAMIGAGAEYKIGINTVIFTDFIYQQGLVNVVQSNLHPTLEIRNTIFAIEFGIKF